MLKKQNKTIIINKLEDVKLSIYIIGYPSKGESIVFTILDSENIYYTGVIDCYETENENKTYNLLKELKIKKINFLCWTHPHEDHTKGFEKILSGSEFDIDNVFLPEGIYGLPQEITEYCQVSKKIVNAVNKRTKNFSVTTSDYQSISLDSKIFSKSVVNMSFNIYGLAPNSSVVREIINDKSYKDHINDFSIAIMIVFEEFKILLTGDIENKTINLINQDFFENSVDFIKIPHHGSSTSSDMLGLFKSNNSENVACSTIYKQHNLPENEILKEYKNFFKNIYITNDENNILKFDFEIINKRIIADKRNIVNKLL